ncbi:LysR family transcriptional regulator [Sinorhizobium sp. CB7]|uniref:LysR family transcriptional regulator n=1 Tax=Sinorhizobium sp. CB7 TaxID=3056949 RepID=UPI0035240103
MNNFLRAVEAGNMTKAAEQLHVSQTALGLQIRNLEAMLGVELLVRHSRGISMTEPGRLLYERGAEIMRLVEEARRDISAFRKTGDRTVSIGLTPSTMRMVGTDFLVTATSDLPGITLRLVEELSFVLMDLLQREEIDFALAYDSSSNQGSMRTALMQETLFFITAPASSFDPGPVPFNEVVASNLALPGDRDNVWHAVHRAAKTSTLPVNVRFTVQSLEAIKTLVERGLATSIVPYGAVKDKVEEGTVVAHRIVDPELKRTLYLFEPPSRLPAAQDKILKSFIDELVATLALRIGDGAQVIGHCGDEPL